MVDRSSRASSGTPLPEWLVTSRRGFLVGAGGLVASGVLAACTPGTSGGGATTAPTSSMPADIQIAYFNEHPRFDGTAAAGDLFTHGIGETLVTLDQNAQLSLQLVEELEQVDESSWRFTLRNDIVFHNGAVVDAAAVKAALEKMASSDSLTPPLGGMTVEVDGEFSGVLHTTVPSPGLPGLLTNARAAILAPESYEANGEIVMPIGTGPFKLEEYISGDRRKLVAHEEYWGGRPGFDTVAIRYITEAQTRVNLIRTGEAAIAWAISPDQVAPLKTADGVVLYSRSLGRTRHLTLNSTSGPTADPVVRRAIALATDRDSIAQSVIPDAGAAQVGIYGPAYPWSNKSLNSPYDPAKAKELLGQAGYSESNPLKVTLWTYESRAEMPLIAQVLQQQYAAVGIEVSIELHPTDFINAESVNPNGASQLILYSLDPLLTYDPQSFLEANFAGWGDSNRSQYTGSDALFTEAQSITDPDKRFAAYAKIEKRMIEEDVPIIVLNNVAQIDATRDYITGYEIDPTATHQLTARLGVS